MVGILPCRVEAVECSCSDHLCLQPNKVADNWLRMSNHTGVLA